MLKPINATPPLPFPSRATNIHDLAAFDQDLVKALYRYLTEMAIRVNQAAMRDEGTFVPDLQFGGASVGMTYAVQTGVFKRVGKLVFITGMITLTAKGASVGNAVIAGLPFAANETSGGSINNYTLTLTTPPSIVVQSSHINLRTDNGAGSDVAMTNANFTNTSSFQFTATYESAA